MKLKLYFHNGFNAATAPLGIKIRSHYPLSSKERLRKEKTKNVGNQPSLALARRSSTDNAVVVFGVFHGDAKLVGPQNVKFRARAGDPLHVVEARPRCTQGHAEWFQRRGDLEDDGVPVGQWCRSCC